jgi:hypothetical protein
MRLRLCSSAPLIVTAAKQGDIMKKLLTIAAMFLVVSGLVFYRSNTQAKYFPRAVFCAIVSNNPCSLMPSYIGPDPLLKKSDGYSGLFGPPPNSVAKDVQTPFDNMAWQMFVALNWAASATKQTAAVGLTAKGPRVWQKYRKVSSLFGNSPVTAKCSNPTGLPVLLIGSDGSGNTEPNNEEYFQASTNLPLIDINGNWAIFERRVNDVEAQYLLAPNGQTSLTLTTQTGQTNFIGVYPKGASFTPSGPTPLSKQGSIEIKTAWRIIDSSKGDNPSRYYTQTAIVAVPGDLVSGGQQVCATVTVGLVGMHIIQRNPLVTPRNGNLLPQWIWATFEHVDNAPMAQFPCNVRNGCGKNPSTNWINQPSCGPALPAQSVRYSFYKQNAGVQGTNIRPAPSSSSKAPHFPWNSKAPYAQGGTTPATAMPQVARCWSIYSTTMQLNSQWRNKLNSYNTPFQNYMLIGTQWGGSIEPEVGNPLPVNAIPAMLSNMTLETYIQNYTGSDTNLPGPGSCVGCHSGAALVVKPYPQSDFSFLPLLAEPATARSKIKTAR